MSEQSKPLPPVPEHTPPLKEDAQNLQYGKFFSQPWTRWFLAIREKLNVIGDSIVNLASVSGNGIIVKSGDNWSTIPTNTGVTPGTYGNSTAVGRFTVGADGRITAAANVTITGGGGGGGGTDLGPIFDAGGML